MTTWLDAETSVEAVVAGPTIFLPMAGKQTETRIVYSLSCGWLEIGLSVHDAAKALTSCGNLDPSPRRWKVCKVWVSRKANGMQELKCLQSRMEYWRVRNVRTLAYEAGPLSK